VEDCVTSSVITLPTLHFTKTEGGICTSKAEAVRQCDFDILLLRIIGNVVTIEVFRRAARIL
jgi:hypothetical protein